MPGVFQAPQLSGSKILVTASRSTTQILTVGVGNLVLFNLVASDPYASYNPATGIFTAPWAGQYRYKGSVLLQGTATSGATPGSFQATLQVNAASFFPAVINLNMTAGIPYTNIVTVEAVFSLGAGGTAAVSAAVVWSGNAGTGIVAANGVATGFSMEYIQPTSA
jgi:hypothetical protein